ncbi:MAG: DUF3473 domain-containing protein [Burkholderiales bacterium]|nr:DUF3473 domain-containing protein [Burkholderiales bacterium]MDR4518454.1 DUF3473 domain-containing protein [Nitrosomonas sp.]
MTIDVEDYFQVSAFEANIPRESWDSIPCRVEGNIDRILGLLDEKQIKATFFTLGWIAQRYPEMVRRIVDNGHELASHGWAHARVTDLSQRQFEEDISRSKLLLEDISGQAILGYRAPSFSINDHNLWALDCLAEAGYRYSSSIYPVQHDHYGMPEAPRFANHPRGESGVLELPVTTIRLCGRNFPAGGGGYFRFWPYSVSKWFIKRLNVNESHAAIFYFHPWEIDVEQPRQSDISFKTRFRHYLNLHRMEERLRSLMHDFKWNRMDKIFLPKELGIIK